LQNYKLQQKRHYFALALRRLYPKTFYVCNKFRCVTNLLLALTNTLAFYVTDLITDVKSFMTQTSVQHDNKWACFQGS
jgi:hypothetical protein